ncbi:MAG: hypothetical protein ACPGVH_09020 [Chitinophagales bacterium]
MNRIFLLVFFMIQSSQIFACCAEQVYKLFPVGEFENEIVMIEMDLFKYCKNGVGIEQENEFWTQKLVFLQAQVFTNKKKNKSYAYYRCKHLQATTNT